MLIWIVTLFAALPAFALSQEPIVKRQLVQVDPYRFQSGLCPGNPLARTPGPRSIEDSPYAILQRGQRTLYAAESAENVYRLPDLQTAQSARQMIDQMSAFAAKIPANYELYQASSDTLSGLKFAIFQARDPGRPWILAIAGTQTSLDWIADLDLGRGQLRQLETLTDVLASCQYLDGSGQPLASHSWIITGHSLGGGLAQALAYHVQARRLSERLLPLKMQLITFNAFGAQQLVKKVEPFHPEIVPYLDARNYFVFGDAVSRIGTHIGATFIVYPPGVTPNSPAPLISRQTLLRHAVTTLDQIGGDIQQVVSGFDRAQPRRPESFFDLTVLGSGMRFFPAAIYESQASQTRRLEILKNMVSGLIASSASPLVKSYVGDLISQEYARVSKPSAGIMAQLYAKQLKQMLRDLER